MPFAIFPGRRLALWCLCLVLCGVSGCQDREADARRQFNAAIADWNSGRLEASMQTLDTIIASYGDTRSATEALEYRATKLAQYREQWSAGANPRAGHPQLVAAVEAGLARFHALGGGYPAALKDVDWNGASKASPDAALLLQCRYERALFDAGYKLDCTEPTRAYLAQIAARRASERSPPPTPAPAPLSATSPQLVTAKVTWGKHFKPAGGVPVDSFHAVYLNTREPDKAIASEKVRTVGINYAWDDFHGIASEDFGAYWVGTVRIERPVTRRFSLSQSWSKARVIIDGKIIYEGSQDGQFRYRFDAGDHLLEVEYINNWHTTDFKLTMDDDAELATASQLSTLLAPSADARTKMLFAAVYEPAGRDHSVQLDLRPADAPLVLILSSYTPVRWVIRNPHDVDLRAVAFGSHSPGSELAGDLEPGVKRIPFRGQLGHYSRMPSCNCSGSSFHCEGAELFSTQAAVEAATGLVLHGFSGQYQAQTLPVPDLVMTAAALAPLRQQLATIAKERAACQRQTAPDFEALIENKSNG